MKQFISIVLLWTFLFSTVACEEKKTATQSYLPEEKMVRIAEIEIKPDYWDEYVAILKEEAEASVRLEPGVICIYPMFQKENPNQIRLLEIYANKEAYASHLQTPHFKHYKEATLHMVKALRLVDMEAVDPPTMRMIFSKIGD